MSPGITSVLSSPRSTQTRVAISIAPVSPGLSGSGMTSNLYSSRKPRRVGIAGDDSDRRPIAPTKQCGKHVVQHGLRQLRARRLIEHGGQPLFCRGRILDRNQDHGWGSRLRTELPAEGCSLRRAAETNESTSRASAALSSALRMMVCVHCTRSPLLRRASAARASRSVADQYVEKIFIGLRHAGDRAGQPLRLPSEFPPVLQPERCRRSG